MSIHLINRDADTQMKNQRQTITQADTYETTIERMPTTLNHSEL